MKKLGLTLALTILVFTLLASAIEWQECKSVWATQTNWSEVAANFPFGADIHSWITSDIPEFYNQDYTSELTIWNQPGGGYIYRHDVENLKPDVTAVQWGSTDNSLDSTNHISYKVTDIVPIPAEQVHFCVRLTYEYE